jgi:hypothetical protein
MESRVDRFTRKQWAQFVDRGRELVQRQSRAQFDLGDLTLEMMPRAPRDGQDHGVTVFLERYARAIGISASSLSTYRHVATAWPEERRVYGVPFSVHAILAPLGNRFELITGKPIDPETGNEMERWTHDAALRAADRAPTWPVTPIEKVNKARTLLKEDEDAALAVTQIVMRPMVAARVMDDPAARHSLREAERDRTRNVVLPPRATSPVPVRPVPRPPVPTPAVRLSDARREVLELLGICTAFYSQIQQRVTRLHVAEYDADAKATILETLQRVHAAADWCETVVKTGDTSMDEGLARLLDGGQS